jgi:hypothetical protein
MSQEQLHVRSADANGSPPNQPANLGRGPGGGVVEQVEEVREREVPDGFDLRHDRVHWGPIIAGLLTAFTTLLLLSLLGLAVGLTTVNAGTATAQGGPPADVGRNSAIWAAISGIVAFLLGGYVAGRTAAIFNRSWGALNGALVFMLAMPVILWLAGQGLGTVLGSLGNLSGALASNPSAAQAAQGAAGQAQATAQSIQPVDVARRGSSQEHCLRSPGRFARGTRGQRARRLSGDTSPHSNAADNHTRRPLSA